MEEMPESGHEESGEQRPVEGQMAPRIDAQVEPEVEGTVDGESRGGSTEGSTAVPEGISAEEQRVLHDFAMYRARLHDIPDARLEQVLAVLRAGQSVRSLAREYSV